MKEYSLEKSWQVLDRTPAVLRSLLLGLDDAWTMHNEGPDTFSPFDVVGHLVHSEKTNWPDRVRMIQEHGTATTFAPFDRFAMYKDSIGKSLDQLLNEFETLRKANMQWVRSLKLSDQDLDKKGTHPQFGEVNLRQLLSAMVVHDLSHIGQVVRVMSKQYKEEVGPWAEFFRLLKS